LTGKPNSKNGKAMIRRVIRRALRILGLRPASGNGVVVNPYLVEEKPRREPGSANLPFGSLDYVDSLTANAQLKEIFIAGNYDTMIEKPDPWIVDCGGNIGLATIRFKQLFPKGRLLVFEADASIAGVLKGNVDKLNLADVEVVPSAAWITKGTISFVREGTDSGKISGDEEGREGAESVVSCERLADWIDRPVDLLKLDVEGAEFAILDDLLNTGKMDQVQRIICECHFYGKEWEAMGTLMSRLARAGFQMGIQSAWSHPQLGGPAIPTPFRVLPSGKCLVQLYAWRQGLKTWE